MGDCNARIPPFSMRSQPVSAPSSAAANCQDGGILSKAVVLDVLAAADGASFTTEANATTPGDFLRIQPIEGAIRVHYIFFQGDAADVAAAGYGQILKNRKQQQPTLDGSFDNDNVCGDAANLPLSDGVGLNVNTFNSQCIPLATNDSPVDVALVNTSGAPITDLCVVLVYEYV